MSIKLVDFCGFQFNGVHSSTLKITRVSNGSRYEDELVPNFQDQTAQVEGNDGTLFWESFYSQKPINIQIAYDDLSEYDIRRLRQVFNGKAIGELIFDETPYKAYTVKVQSPPQLQFICFDRLNNEGKVERVYKGEGTISLIAYYPYAKSVFKFLEQYEAKSEFYTNLAEWATASGMLEHQGNYDGTGTDLLLYNAGDIEADWQAFYTLEEAAKLSIIVLNDGEGQMGFDPITSKGPNDVYIRLNSRTNLIEGCDENKIPTGTLYNEFFVAGEFFKIPPRQEDSTFSSGQASCAEIRYNYLYY